MSAQDSPQAAALAMVDDTPVTRWDRPRWISVFSSHNPTIREVTECLGLGLSASSSTTNRGIPKFDNPEYRKLSSEVTRLSKELPKERDALLDFAADPHSLDAELNSLLATYGPAIWGRETDRSCLLTPDPLKKTYPKHLYYEDADDKETLKIHLHRWIIIKACYYIRNMKLKRPSAANDYETIADMEHDADLTSPTKAHLAVKLPLPPTKLQNVASPSQSPNGTPLSKSLTPPADAEGRAPEYAVKPVNGVKRKSFNSQSDSEEGFAPAKRFQSHSVPISRTTPRKSIISFVTDGPVSDAPPPSHSVSPEISRPSLIPLSNSDLNGTPRPPNGASGSFTAVNTGSFTAVNTTEGQPVKSSPSQLPPVPAMAPRQNYSSPYDANHFGATTTKPTSTPPKSLPPSLPSTSAAPGFQTVNSPTTTNGLSTRNSPIVQHGSHPQPPPQHANYAQPQPNSRSSTPVMHHHHTHRPTLNQQRSSRSNTPIAPAIAAPAPQAAQHQPAHIQPAPAPRTHHVPVAPALAPAPVPSVPSVPSAAHYAAAPPQALPVLKSQAVEVVPLPSQAAAAMDLGLLQCEVLGLLMQYLFPRNTTPPEENHVLYRLEVLWHHGAPIFRKQIGSLYDLQAKTLSSWITERRKMTQLRCEFAYAPGVPAAEMVGRLLAMNDLRVMRLKWKNMSSADGLSAEDLLCRTFSIITNTEGTEYLFKDGLDRLNEDIFEFLRTEDMRILMHKRS